MRVVGGYISDRIGGINTLSGVLVLVAISLVACGFAGSSLAATTLLFMLCFAALGAGNGSALFQLVPLRWPLATAVAGSMIGKWARWAAASSRTRWACPKRYLAAPVGLRGLRGAGGGDAGDAIVQIRWTRMGRGCPQRARSSGAPPHRLIPSIARCGCRSARQEQQPDHQHQAKIGSRSRSDLPGPGWMRRTSGVAWGVQRP